MDSEPEVALAPDQEPEALQFSALVEDQERVAAALWAMLTGPSELLALMSAVGGGTTSMFQDRVAALIVPGV